MAREGGGGGAGAFGWTLLGILVGVAATLAVQTLLHNRLAREVPEAAAPSASVAIVAAPPAVRAPVVKTPTNLAVATPKTDSTTPSQEDVQDDAAAVGMTSRSRPSDGQSAPTGAPN